MQRAAWRAHDRRYARSSLLGPIFLIVIGVLALLMTMRRINIADFWQTYGHWWPLVFIGAGVLLALESLVFSRHSRIRLGGGVVFLLIVLAVLGIAASQNHVHWKAIGDQLNLGDTVNLPRMFGSKHQSQEQILHTLPDHAVLVIQNPNGDITIDRGTDSAADGQMHLTLDKTVYTGSDPEAHRKLAALEPLITSSGNVVTVHMPSEVNQSSDMKFTLPADTALDVHATHGDVTVHGRQALVSVKADHGDVQLTGITGAVQVIMHDGDFSASNIHGPVKLGGRVNDVSISQVAGAVVLDGDFFGDVHLGKLQGPIHLHSTRTDILIARLAGSISLDGDDLTIENASGPIVVSTAAKDVSLRRVDGPVQVRNSNGSVEVKALDPLGAMDIKNSNGSVDLTLPSDARFSLEAVAGDGEVHTEFQLPTQENGDRSMASGSIGTGGPLIKISAEKGDIALHKQ
ncbi:MAG: DUF4097 family beta strand repeat-containing protein [Acidobacteriaceae bacterium]